MRIALAVPGSVGGNSGNRVTARRWSEVLTDLGHEVDDCVGDGQPPAADVLVALHARRSAPAVAAWRERDASAPLVVALTGTDLYRDLPASPEARRSVELADRLVVLQPLAVEELPPAARGKARVVYQSVDTSAAETAAAAAGLDGALQVCQLAHLRAVKDPLLAAEATARLPAGVDVRVTHLGAPLDERLAARAASAGSARYRWRGAVPRPEALAVLARSHALLLTSTVEGGANAVSEALALGVPVLSSRIAGSVGMLGADYPGYFAPGDADALAALLERAAGDRAFLAGLAERCRARAWIVEPAEERRRWRSLLAEVT